MVKSPEHEARAQRVASYMLGWRKGATGSAYTDEMMANADFKRGHEDARKVKIQAHAAFCTEIGHDPMLDILR